MLIGNGIESKISLKRSWSMQTTTPLHTTLISSEHDSHSIFLKIEEDLANGVRNNSILSNAISITVCKIFYNNYLYA